MTEFQQVWDRYEAWQPTAGMVYRYRRTYFPTMTLEQVQAREAEIAPFPDHPGRMELQTQRRRLEVGPSVIEFQVWWEGAGAFRLNQTFVTEPGSDAPHLTWLDQVASPDSSWRLAGPTLNLDAPIASGQLSVFDPAPAVPDENSPESSFVEAHRAIGMLVTGGFVRPYISFVEPSGASWNGEVLVGAAAPSGERQVPSRRFLLRRVVDAGAPEPALRTERIEIDPSAPGAGDGWTMQFTQWRLDPVLDGWVAGRVDKVSPQGRVLERFEFVDTRPLEAGEFSAVTRTPTPDGVDAIRGEYVYGSVMDNRRGVENFTVITPDGPVVAPLPSRAGRVTTVPRWLSWTGWGAAGVLIATLVGIRVWRGRS
ncbi:MAG: hypothetical protein KDA05_10305 [Phycisphaerales bacterium]|nr:hypothetical protein [Phycisphaerales bacterium]